MVNGKLTLIGGGHSHLAVLKSLGVRPLNGVCTTLISPETHTPYSGMLPGHIAGHYDFDQAHIDLRPLSRFAGARFYQTRAVGIDFDNRRVICAEGAPVEFDMLSINLGSTPSAHGVPGVHEHALPIKPIDPFLKKWREWIRQIRTTKSALIKVVVVGGGAAGVELALATRHRLLQVLSESGHANLRPEYHLVTASSTILPTHPGSVQSRFERILGEHRVRIHVNSMVTQVEQGRVHCRSGATIEFDCLFWAVNAAPPEWIVESGIETDAEGFVLVNDCLQSVSHPFVFAAGDVATIRNQPRPKAGVFAVRQGPVLSENLRLALAGKPLMRFRAQKNFLGLISTGNRYAIASRGRWSIEGRWVWCWKDWIDRRWIRQFQKLPGEKAITPRGN